MLEPLNVPEVLFPFAGRDIMNIRTDEDLKQLYKFDIVKKILDGIFIKNKL